MDKNPYFQHNMLVYMFFKEFYEARSHRYQNFERTAK